MNNYLNVGYYHLKLCCSALGCECCHCQVILAVFAGKCTFLNLGLSDGTSLR